MTILYEVNLDLHPSISEEYIQWLEGHMDKMFTLIEGLESAELTTRDATPGLMVASEFEDDGSPKENCKQVEASSANWVGLTATYRVPSMEALEDYLQNRAAPMRQEGISKFGTTKYKAFRRIQKVRHFAGATQ